MKAVGDLSNSGKLGMAEASQNQLSVTFVGKGDVCKPQWTPELGSSEVHASNSSKPSMTDQASLKQPSVIHNYKCKFVMTKEERARQRFMRNRGKCRRLYDFEPKCIPDKLLFHPSPKRRTSWEHSRILRFRTSSSLPDPCFTSSLNFHYDMMVREEPESPTH
ncbi:hypothetical protein M0R45_030454 [Rubus argutus]|uniref:Uncharacterized protein n=1 Tax=Rubus argutus TaxID=59490 RepID=A0AAW1WF78_RUBAR